MDLGWVVVVVVVVMYILRKVLSLDPLCFFVTADYEVEVKKCNGEPSKSQRSITVMLLLTM